uniref:Uncharacterized protein MANES_15G087400 n=1 Tax=Rhizophora mucronata TaxID=61149 RepID=A0A2P2LX88_RHIMU
MGVEVVGFEMALAPAETVTEKENSVLHEKGNGKLDKESEPYQPIKFGTHEEQPAKGEGNGLVDGEVPKDVVDEWPAPKQIHYFYFVRYRPFDDPKLKAELDKADKDIQKKNQSRFQILEKLRAKRLEKSELANQLKTLTNDNRHYNTILDEKKREIEPLLQEMSKLRSTNSGGRYGLCSSEEELNDLIYSLQYCIQHESLSLTEEKQILKEIKQLEGTREKVIANAAARAKLQESLGQKEAIQGQVKLMGVDLDGIKKEKQALYSKIQKLESEIKILQVDLETATNERDKFFDSIKKLRSKRDAVNAHFYQNRTTTTDAKKLAAEKDVKALEELSHREVEKFMSLWNNDKAFRDDYERRILLSLDSRQLSRDGRMRNPDEKPLVAVEAPVPSEPESVLKSNVKQLKEEPKSTPPKDILPSKKIQKETNETDSKNTSGNVDQEINDTEMQQKSPPALKVVDEAKLKELRREEEIEKAKQALERKKKLADKAAVKAAIRAQKEAEKKLKEIV